MIIIFDLHGQIPCYSACMETFEEAMLGSFELRENMFRKTCGIRVSSDGKIFLDLSAAPGVENTDDAGEAAERATKTKQPSPESVVYTRREDRNAKRFLTLTAKALDRWPVVTRRVTVDLATDVVVADEVIRGLSRSALYRALPMGVSRIRTTYIADPRVTRSFESAMCFMDADMDERDHFACPMTVPGDIDGHSGDGVWEKDWNDFAEWTGKDFEDSLGYGDTPIVYVDPSLIEPDAGPAPAVVHVDAPAVPTPPDPFPIESVRNTEVRDGLYAKSRYHCLTHTPFNRFCHGCKAKARNKSHHKETFLRKQSKKYCYHGSAYRCRAEPTLWYRRFQIRNRVAEGRHRLLVVRPSADTQAHPFITLCYFAMPLALTRVTLALVSGSLSPSTYLLAKW